jgi:hypothetical protein
MNFNYNFFLLLVVLSAHFESPQQGEPPDPLDFFTVAVCPNSSSDSLGILAPVLLLQSKVFGPDLPQNMVLPQNEVYRTVLPHNEVFGVVLSQTEINITVLFQNGVFNNVIVSRQLSNRVKYTVEYWR